MKEPGVLITPGDPAGIGFEITIKALLNTCFNARIAVLCDSYVLERTARAIGIHIVINKVKTARDIIKAQNTINIVEPDSHTSLSFEFGKILPECGLASYNYIKRAVELILDKQFDALVTGPINKEALKAAGVKQHDHTSILKDLTHSEKVGVMFEVDRLRIFFLSRHSSLVNAIRYINFENVYRGIIDSMDFLGMLGESDPVLGVSALNPHGGEGGMFGNEEIKYIEPAVKRAREMGYKVMGPFPADSIFHRALKGEFNAVLSLYHDQGHIAAKTYDFDRTVSVTVGLPFIRTSVDHGTAFDIAGKGVASPVGMTHAILTAIKYVFSYR